MTDITNLPSLYSVTGDIKDINTLLISRDEAVQLTATVPNGWVLVPVKADLNQLCAGEAAWYNWGQDNCITTEVNFQRVYKAMLSATPAAPQPAPAGSGGWESHAKELERELAYWRQRAKTMLDHQDGECWYWQGDGTDHPESMVGSLPVVIRADDLRALMAPAAPQPAQPLDSGVMELAESVGLIGPASRTDDLHEAIQRFHDLIVVNASIKAALHFADGLAKPAQPLTDEQCDAIYTALDVWARKADAYEFGLPRAYGGGAKGGREIIRNAISGVKND